MAEDFNHIDQIIRERFENFEPEPPAQVWDKIKAGINQNPTPPSSPGIILPIIVAISILIFLSGLIHHFTSSNIDEGKQASSINVHTAGVISTGSTTFADATLQESFYNTPSTKPVPQSIPEINTPDYTNTIPVRVPFAEDVKSSQKKIASDNKAVPLDEEINRSGQWQPGLVQSLQSGQLSYADAKRYKLNARDIRKLSMLSDDYVKKNPGNWSLGLYFNPEVNHCQDEGIENTISYNIGIMPELSFKRFFIQSGINVRLTHDKGNLAVDYNRYLGSYEDVYEVTFDSTENGIIPTYHTQTVEVYDTINHYSISETKANYTYLEVPVLVGYRYSFGKVSLFGKAGPAASFLMIKDVPQAGYPEDNARIVNVHYQIPVRSAVNWHMMMGAGIDYEFADKLSFSLEPTFRFALKQEYKIPDSKSGNTTSFGIRAGLNYKF